MIQSKGIVNYQLIPYEKIKIEPTKIETSLDFLSGLKTFQTYDWVVFSDSSENIQISVSTAGMIEISVDIQLNKLKDTIYLLDKLTKKILSRLKTDAKFFVEMYIGGLDSIGLEHLIKQKLEFNEFKEISFNLDEITKVVIFKNQNQYTILIKGLNNISKIFQIYSFIMTGKISDLIDFSIKKINISITKTLTKKIFLDV